MTARILPMQPIDGHGIVLDPILGDDALEELAPVLWRPETFAGGWGGGPAGMPDSAGGFVAFLRGFLPAFAGERSFVVRDAADGRAIGTTSLGHIDRRREVCEIGWTAYAPEAWGTRVNPVCKLLLLDHAFGNGYGKVILNVDAVNERSLAAVAKLGAVREGVLRRDRPRPDGTWRDTVVHSILEPEYRAIRERLLARLGD